MKNWLPCDGEVQYHDKWMAPEMAGLFFETLSNTIRWQEEKLRIAGREVIAKRKVAWYGDKPYEYHYSGSSKTALPWTSELLELKNKAEITCGAKYNSCLLNFYPDGNAGMAWHSDNEKTLVPLSSIASISLGYPRRFLFKHKNQGIKLKLQLAHGSLLEMKGETQQYWLHSLAKSKTVLAPRINLTFRLMREDAY